MLIKYIKSVLWRVAKFLSYIEEARYLKVNADALSRIGSVSKVDDRTDEFDEDRKKQTLCELHDSPLGGHRGMNKT